MSILSVSPMVSYCGGRSLDAMLCDLGVAMSSGSVDTAALTGATNIKRPRISDSLICGRILFPSASRHHKNDKISVVVLSAW